ncbi:MAG: TonB-dependent receptor plug domain-containing protein [Desulfococcaceae bacterium]
MKLLPDISCFRFIALLCTFMCLFLHISAAAYSREDDGGIDFTSLSLEELKNVKITSVSRTPEKLSEAAAAVFVITGDDIRRSGATSIPEVLRMAPGVQVARISATEWAVNIRGLNEQFSNKLLVLMDGRSVYTHVYSGVFWDMQDTVLEDIERIEIIRGPGAALWGLNAVNGVINIITRSAQQTQGSLVSLLGGSEEGIGAVRYGGLLGDGTYYRVYAKYFNRGSLTDSDRDIRNDPSKGDWRSGRAGFRMDTGEAQEADHLRLQGEVHTGRFDNDMYIVENNTSAGPVRISDVSRASGGHMLAQWEHRFSETSDTVMQFWYDWYDKDFEGSNVRADTLDADMQFRTEPLSGHNLVWGTNLRYIRDRFGEGYDISVEPAQENLFTGSFFVQDRMQMIPDRVMLSLGVRCEYNDYTGWETQPSARILWFVKERHSLWAAVSRAARVPSRAEDAGVQDSWFFSSASAEPLRVRVAGNTELGSESLWAYESGYRFQPAENLWFVTTAFYNEYDDLIDYSRNDSASEDEIMDFRYENIADGESWGIELAADWQILPAWRLQGAYTFLETAIHMASADADAAGLTKGSNPRNQFSLRSVLDIGRDLESDIWFRYVDRLSDSEVDEYVSLDARLAWRMTPQLEVAVTGQNLLEPDHAEFSSLKVERSFHFRLQWCF